MTEPADETLAVVVAGVTLTHPDRVLWPATGERPALTKLDIASYFAAAAERILPHVAGRPLSVVRAPGGVGGRPFFQRHPRPRAGATLDLLDPGERLPLLTARDARGLVALAQWGVVELHPWGCAPGDPDTPDLITFDLDPGEGVTIDGVVAVAGRVRATLEGLGLVPFVKTTGGRGLHVVVPICADVDARVSWTQALGFARAVCARVEAETPGAVTLSSARVDRGGRVFLDYLRNARAATAVAPWSPRARPGAGLACPLDWSAVVPGLDPTRWTLWTRAAVLARPDPWADLRHSACRLRPALKAMDVI